MLDRVNSMEGFIHEVVLVFVIVAILLIIVHIFLDYKWKLDILHKIDTCFGEINQRYRDNNTSKLSSISDEVQRFTREWENGIDRRDHSSYTDSQDERARRAMDDFFSRYNE